MDNIAKCEVCGGTPVLSDYWQGSSTSFYLDCKCGMSATASGEQEVINDWNTKQLKIKTSHESTK